MAGVSSIARAAGLKDEKVRALFDAITEAVKDGQRVQIKDFGSFFMTERAERTIRSPQLPPPHVVHVPAQRTMRFRPGPALKQALNGRKKLTSSPGKPAKAPTTAAR